MALDKLWNWVRFCSVGYLRGRGLLVGAVAEVLPRKATAPGVFALHADPIPHEGVSVCGSDLSNFAPRSFDWVLIGPEASAQMGLEVLDKLKLGGHAVVLSKNASGANERLAGAGSWLTKLERQQDEYSLGIYKSVNGPRGLSPAKPLSGRPRACIVRYGAIGDMIMVTPLIKQLAEDGYEVTVNTTSYSAEVLAGNPHVSNIVIQEREAIPNPDLGAYWKFWEAEYSKYINLSESIEGALLKVEGRREFFTRQAWRHQQANKNYFDYTMELGGYPQALGRRGELFFSRDERREAKRLRDKFSGKFLVLWALSGSSHHKQYPLLVPVMADWLATKPDARVVLMGSKRDAEINFDHPQVMNAAGQWPLRKSLAATTAVDLVVGPESMLINAAGCGAVPKIPLLSHSTHENLCKYFENDYCLAPDQAVAPCHPCHQLHYSLQSCVLQDLLGDGDEVLATVPACAVAISGERVQARMDTVYSKWRVALDGSV